MRRSRGEHGAGRVLVGGRDDHRVGAGALEPVDPQPVLVDRDRHGLEPGAGGDQALLGVARVLERDPPRAARRQRAADDVEALR